MPWTSRLILAAVILTLGVLCASIASVHDVQRLATQGDLSRRLLPPGSGGHLLGTDDQGRDILARVIAGMRYTFAIAAFAITLAACIGVPFGMLGVVGNRWVRTLVARVVDFAFAFPSLVLAIVMVGLLGRSSTVLAVALGLFSWPVFAKVTYGEGRGIAVQQYVIVARLFGVHRARLVLRHIAPGVAPTLAVVTAFQFADLLIAAAGLSFLGLGPPLGTPEWGTMLSDARSQLTGSPWLLLGPGLAIAWSAVLANLVGDQLVRATRHERRPTHIPM